LVVLLAAAVARRHPKLAAAISGPLTTGAPQLVTAWAAQLHRDLHLEVSSGARDGASGALILHTTERDVVFLKPAFERANAALDGLGWRLIETISRRLSGHNPVVTPIDLFWRLCYSEWYEATTDAEFRQNLKDYDGVEDDDVDSDRLGPDSYWKDFPGMPRDEIVGRLHHQRRGRKWSARTCRRHAQAVADPWAQELLAVMADAARFDQSHPTPVWHVQPNDADWEQCAVAFWVRWSEDDNMPHWIDLAYEVSWNSGMGTDATLVYECPNPRYHDADAIQGSLDKFVAAAEACSAHIPVMDKLFAVLGDAGEEQ
jgi:hypothetical protein